MRSFIIGATLMALPLFLQSCSSTPKDEDEIFINTQEISSNPDNEISLVTDRDSIIESESEIESEKVKNIIPKALPKKIKKKKPKPQAVGSATKGCLLNGATLPTHGRGYQKIHLTNKTQSAHPLVIQFIKQLGSKVRREGWGVLLVDDLSHEEGGPLSYGHISHQNGLDMDLYYWMLHPQAVNRPLRPRERELVKPISYLNAKGEIDLEKWRFEQGQLLKVVSRDKRVERIFVHPKIKKHLCGFYDGERWLMKLRPWWGHDEMFHVRLKCPSDSPNCQGSRSPIDTLGCGREIKMWDRRLKVKKPPKRPKYFPRHPAC